MPVLVLTTALFSQQAAAAPKFSAEPTPPQPMEQKMTVKRGGSVDIPLRIYGTRAQTLTWIIRQQPAHGKLSSVRATAPETAVVTYRPPSDLRVVSDRFTFSVRSNEGVSAAADVTIAITDEEPRIVAAAEMDFGALLIGESATKVLEFTNGGGGIAEGGIEVDAPWRIEGVRRYKLPAGERHVAKIVFAPDRAGKFESEVRFTSQPDRVIALRGVAEEALAVAPVELVLAHDAGRPLRAASFELRNNTDAPLNVAVAASPRLILRQALHVPAHGSAAVSVQTAEKDAAPLDETIRFTAGTLVARLPVKAAALPAMVSARPQSVAFRRVGAGGIAKERIVFENQGGMETKVKLAVGAPFSVEESGFALAPGGAKEVVVTLAAVAAGRAQSVLKVAVDGGGFDIPVEADISATSAPVAVRTRQTPAVAPAPQDVDPPETVTAMSGVFAAEVASVGKNAATFQWQGSIPAGAKLRCLLRSLSLDEDGELVVTFNEYPSSKIEQRGDANLVTVGNLEPGKAYMFFVEAVTSEGSIPLTFVEVRTPAPPPRAPVFSLVNVLIALAVMAGGASLWQRTRRS